ncbi:MAG: GTP-binding protein [Thiotrichaceae bacterium]
MNDTLANIKTNLITGFLGVGKTSTILHLMTQKPVDEKWSVLVNEFGSVGIDGAIYKAKGIAVKEIPGGCMCCAAGVPLQVAINQILRATKPQRLLIEPSGLGHPKRVLDTLRGEHFQGVLDIRASVCLIDPRHLLEKRYTTHANFIDQIAMADVLMANKMDKSDSKTRQHLSAYITTIQPPKLDIIQTEFGRLDVSILDLIPKTDHKAQYPHHHAHSSTDVITTDGYQSIGCHFPKVILFSFKKISILFKQLDHERIKAILHTDEGWKVFNMINGQLQITEIRGSADNRVEIISHVATATNKHRTEDANKIMNKQQLTNALKRCSIS